MDLFCYGIDPLLTFLDKRLKGILISSTPVQGPRNFLAPPLHPLEERYRILGYADDVKPAITTMEEFLLVDKAMLFFEQASGCRLHRDPASKKCKFLPLGRWRGSLTQEDIPCKYMTISDHLDMVGVELRASWVQTRRANGDIAQQRINDTVRRWKTGKFMELSLRSWSLNMYCFSKVWFRTHSVDLREMDVMKITSMAKSWLYGDMLLKPEEVVLHRPVTAGGLSVLNVRCKALAGLIRSFLETACMPRFKQSLYHQLLFRYHVLEDRTITDPGYPPFYSQHFFSVIHDVHHDTPLNVSRMTEKQWYQYLLEEKVTTMETEQGRNLIPCRVETRHPEHDWETAWRRARLLGLGPTLTSFLFKVLHDLLPTQERISRTNPAVTGWCSRCITEDHGETENLDHALISCPANNRVGIAILECLPQCRLQGQDVLRLQFAIEGEQELPVVWFLAAAWSIIWGYRSAGRREELYRVRADLEAKVSLLKGVFGNQTS